MTVQHPEALMLIALAVLPFIWQKPGAIFIFSSFLVWRQDRFSRWLMLAVKLSIALAVVGLALGLADVSIHNIVPQRLEEGSLICFVRDASWSMFTKIDGNSKEDKIVIATKLIERFVNERPRGDQYCLVDFGSAAVTRAGLVSRELFLPLLKAPLFSMGGTIIDTPLVRTISLLPYERSVSGKAIVLVSDGWGRLDNEDDIVRWLREANITFFWIFIGTPAEWQNAPVHKIVEKLSPPSKTFNAQNQTELADAMSRVRMLQRGLAHYQAEQSDFSLSPICYSVAWFSLMLVATVVILETSFRRKPTRRGAI